MGLTNILLAAILYYMIQVVGYNQLYAFCMTVAVIVVWHVIIRMDK